MLIIESIPLMQQHVCCAKQKKCTIALVPTMGNLHEGHMKLIDEARSHADIVIVSIFVNPMQFDSIDDLKCYPRSPQEDCEKLNQHNVDYIFTPSISDIYPQGVNTTTYVEVPNVSNILEGTNYFRHFRGVSTIISKLFNLIQPDFAYFGEKDYYQLMLVRKITTDMNYNIKIIGVPIVRTKDGLAFSSRNCYLTVKERKIAPELYKTMNIIAENIISKKTVDLEKITIASKQSLNNKGFYDTEIQIRDADTLEMLTKNTQKIIILMSGLLGKLRLIDNKIIKSINNNL